MNDPFQLGLLPDILTDAKLRQAATRQQKQQQDLSPYEKWDLTMVKCSHCSDTNIRWFAKIILTWMDQIKLSLKLLQETNNFEIYCKLWELVWLYPIWVMADQILRFKSDVNYFEIQLCRVQWNAAVIQLLWRSNFGTVWIRYKLGIAALQ